MSRLLRNPHVLFLVCSQIVLVGCQHPLASSVAKNHPAGMNMALFSAEATGRVRTAAQRPQPGVEADDGVSGSGLTESPKPKDEPPLPKVQNESEHPIVQMGNDFVELLKIFTGR
jgi:hypothetical protein